jgi:Ca2+-binding RTX toxin-like protein
MELAVLMNNKAPGTTLLSELVAKSAAGSSLTEIAEHLAGRAEFKAAYPTFQTATEFATEWLGNALPEASAALLAECVTIVEAHINGGGSIPALVVSVQAFMTDPANADGAVKTHIDNFTNKVTVATYHTITKEAAAEWEIPSTVSSDATTITAANAAVDTATAPAAAASQTKSLTVGVDNVIGGSGDDLVLGSIDTTTVTNNTWSTADVLNGGDGADTLQIAVANQGGPTVYTPALITNMEAVRIVNTSAAAATFDLTSTAGLTSVELSSSAAGSDFNNLVSTATKLNATANTGASDFAFQAAALLGADTSVDLTLTSNAGNVTVGATGAGVESVKITAVGVNTAGRYVGTSTDVKTLTVEGTGSLTVNALDMPGVTSLDATANSGGVNYNATAANTTLKGGSGNDVLSDGTGNDVITGGTGADTLTGGTGNDNIDGGAGNDVAIVSNVTVDDTVTGGEGTDTLSLAAGTTYTAVLSAGSGISGFEVISNSAAITQNMSGLGTNAITTLAIGNAGAAVIQEGAIDTIATTAASGTAVLGLKTDSAADAVTVALGNAAAGRTLSLAALDYETININSTGFATGNAVSLADTEASYLATTAAEIAARTAAAAARTATDLTTVNITGDKTMGFTSSAKSTALATVNAADFTGPVLTMNASSSDAAMTVTANSTSSATITTGDGADTVTVGDGGTALTNTITTGKGNDIVTSGAGADIINVGTGSTAGANKVTSGDGIDNITAGDGADIIDAGAGNDIITAAKGADSITAGAGDDNVTTTDGNDTVTGGTGNDIISTGKGADSIVAGDGNDVITAGSGSDYADGGTGNDTFTMGTGDDTVVGGAGNDSITLTSLTNGDNIDGGADTDTLTLSAIASSATPKNIAGIEALTVTALGGGATDITVNLTNVSDLATLTATDNSTGTLTVSNLPSTLTTINLADSGTTDTSALSYSSGPTGLTLNAYAVDSAATNITSLNAPLTINSKMGTNLAGTAQGYATGNVTTLGTMSTDATSITINSEAIVAGAGVGTAEFTVGAITDAVLESITINTGANTDNVVSSADLTTTSAEFTSATINVGGGSGASLQIGEIIANSATAVSLGITVGDQADLQLGNGAANSFAAADVTVSGTLGTQSTLTSSQKIVSNDIVSNTWTAGAGTTATIPAVEVDAATGTIGPVSLTSGIAGNIVQTIGSTVTPLSIGAVTLAGGGTTRVVLGATAAATVASGASSQGNISAAGMTSSLSAVSVDASASVGAFSLVGSAGNDTITSGVAADTINTGSGTDTITLQALNLATDTDTIRHDGVSAPVVVVGNANDIGTDIINFWDVATAGLDTLEITATSADTAWSHATHVLMGTQTGVNNNTGDIRAYTNKTLLIQLGNPATITDAFDIALNVYNDAATTAAGAAADVRAAIAMNLTGTSGNDSLTMGPLNDTVTGGFGVDTIDGNGGGDVINGGAGNDILDYNALADSLSAGGATSPILYDTVTIGISTTNKDSIDVADIAAKTVDANSTVPQAVSLTGATETTVTLLTAAIEAAITGAANEVSLVKVSDAATDTSADGNFSGYYLVVNDGTPAIGASDMLIKLVGIADTTVVAETGTDIYSFT